MLMFLLLAPTE